VQAYNALLRQQTIRPSCFLQDTISCHPTTGVRQTITRDVAWWARWIVRPEGAFWNPTSG